ncbi:hypothetical protein F3Y22_tig00110556pilonHSYRG00805 [Hibiscus syriacus]|uniref:Uncharacterized protein n=1 Tax=Hibiscus syriacus TaxID=106335 RepID=A0A6A3AAT0_HIBSY|nr:hypothetical protein F3Y22_tig00110556pilonHSYRG00805 [Hibiscus syriacus]
MLNPGLVIEQNLRISLQVINGCRPHCAGNTRWDIATAHGNIQRRRKHQNYIHENDATICDRHFGGIDESFCESPGGGLVSFAKEGGVVLLNRLVSR